MHKERLALLQDMPVFGGLLPDTLEYLVSMAQQIPFETNTFLYREGESADSMLVLEDGEVAILKERDGKTYQLGVLGRGDCVGEMALIDMRPRSASVRALSPCKALIINHGAFCQLHKRDIYQFTLLQLNISREICRRLRKVDGKLFDAMLKLE